MSDAAMDPKAEADLAASAARQREKLAQRMAWINDLGKHEAPEVPIGVVAEVREVVPSGGGGYITLDSGKRAEFDSGMVRDTEHGKARFDLLLPRDVPYQRQFLTRFAELLARGAEKYNARNWELAAGDAEMERFRSSALRHMIQWACGDQTEDHAAAIAFNVMAAETLHAKQ